VGLDFSLKSHEHLSLHFVLLVSEGQFQRWGWAEANVPCLETTWWDSLVLFSQKRLYQFLTHFNFEKKWFFTRFGLSNVLHLFLVSKGRQCRPKTFEVL
jgi:hypothetical protein